MRRIWTAIAALFMLNGCGGWTLEPSDKAPETEYEKRIYQQQDALEQQQRTMLNAYHT
jgi:predicted small lipoprotein YifL